MKDSHGITKAKRVTLMLDIDILKKLYEIQAKQIRESNKSVSFSGVVNEILRKYLKWIVTEFAPDMR